MKTLGDYNIYAGLNGGYGGASYIGTLYQVTEEYANEWAWQEALEIADSYSNLGGYSYEDALEDANGDEDTANDLHRDHVESWLDYWVRPVNDDPDYDPDYHFELN